jgi:hypothetical protein
VHRSRRGPLLFALLGVLVVAVGVIVFVAHRHDFPGGLAVGVSGYQPLEALSDPSPGGVLWTGTAVAGLGVVVVGLVLLAGVVGFVLGRARGPVRRGPAGSPSTPPS